mgnify:CR=1 FL=1|tara:strand:+ start:111 stop:704 length:594 start_codon:yes stop_codon:yes gene_type:complete
MLSSKLDIKYVSEMTDSGKSKPQDSASSKQPQKVEVVVASPSTQGEVNILGELAIFVLRIGFSLFMIHHGLEKLQDPQGFGEFVVGKYFDFLPGDPVFWTFAAAITQIACPIGLAIGIFPRICAFGLLNTMLFAIYFHLLDTGLEGFPFAVVEQHNYAFELSAIYAAISLYFVCAGPGRLSAFRKSNKVTYYPNNKE